MYSGVAHGTTFDVFVGVLDPAETYLNRYLTRIFPNCKTSYGSHVRYAMGDAVVAGLG